MCWNSIRRISIALSSSLSVVVAAAFLAPSARADIPQQMTREKAPVEILRNRPGETLGPRAALFEEDFLVRTLDRNAYTLGLTKACMERADRADLREACRGHHNDVLADSNVLVGFLKEWHGLNADPSMQLRETQRVQHLRTLSGAEFDETILGLLVRQQDLAVMDAGACVAHAEHTRLESFCANSLQNGRNATDLLTGYQCTWFGECSRP